MFFVLFWIFVPVLCGLQFFWYYNYPDFVFPTDIIFLEISKLFFIIWLPFLMLQQNARVL